MLSNNLLPNNRHLNNNTLSKDNNNIVLADKNTKNTLMKRL